MKYLDPVTGTFTLRSFAPFWWAARHWSAFHSPLLYGLFTACAGDHPIPESFKRIEKVRRGLLRSRERLQRTDHGAGSQALGTSREQSVGAIARHALSNTAQCRFMARLSAFLEAGHILELGTSLGISAAYLAAGHPSARITTVEGDPAVAERALRVFDQLGYVDRITCVTDTFDRYLDTLTPATTPFDLIFLDGHHQGAALLHYYERLRPWMHPATVIIVDDIYWSADMQHGWQSLIGRPEVRQSTDCFRFGLIFFDPRFQDVAHHRVRLPLAAYAG